MKPTESGPIDRGRIHPMSNAQRQRQQDDLEEEQCARHGHMRLEPKRHGHLFLPHQDRSSHSHRIGERSENKQVEQRRAVDPIGQVTDGTAPAGKRQVAARLSGGDADIVLGTRVSAVQAECAIEVAHLLREEEVRSAPLDTCTATNALLRGALGADSGIPRSNLHWRDE